MQRQPGDALPVTWSFAAYFGFFCMFFSYALASAYLLVFRRISFCRVTRPRTVEFRPLIGKWQMLRLDELLGYSECSYPVWSRQGDRGRGLALYHASGSHVQFNDYHLNGVEEFQRLLDAEGVHFMGKETSWWFPIMKRRYKFDPN
jgi:hypothetical protein